MNAFTALQQAAINGHGNLLVVAGAGTGKTLTLVARCLRLIAEQKASLENILMVTFTEAAAAEMRARIRIELRRLQAAEPDDEHLAQQLALLETAHICTLHSFCLRLARDHFHELGLDPQFSVLDEQQTRPLIREALTELLEENYAANDPAALAVQSLVRNVGRGSDGIVRKLVIKLHQHSQALPDPVGWLDEQLARFERSDPVEWRRWFLEAVSGWRAEFLEAVVSRAGDAPAMQLCRDALSRLPAVPEFIQAGAALKAVRDADRNSNWPHGTKGKVRDAFEDFFDNAEFLASLLPDAHGNDPLVQDWEWVRPQMVALVTLAREFTARFTAAKRELAGVDFADLEQCALQLLRQPAIAAEWRARLAQVFVDEYQDINAAQDAILTALSRDGPEANRFLVGDVKQSIYRFRLANPRIFGTYDARWSKTGSDGRRIPLTENFRSREGLLNFVNPLFAALMRPEVGGLTYEALEFGARKDRVDQAFRSGNAPCVEFHLLARADETITESDSDEERGEVNAAPDLLAIEREARLVARQLRELKENGYQVWDKDRKGFRPVEWSDMAVLLRSPSGRVEAFAMEFGKAGVPLAAGRGGFFASLEVSDLLNLLRLLDNPLQDIPLAAVLRSPLVGLSLDELAQIRAHNPARLFWTALVHFREVHRQHPKAQSPKAEVETAEPTAALYAKVGQFFDEYHRWRDLVRHTSLSQCLETALAETHYEAMLRAGARGEERAANVQRLLDLARQFDPYQRQGLYRFLRFVEAQEEEELDLQPGLPPEGNAVQLMSIHKSKGLEFPVVALACLGTRFNERDLNEPILLSEHHGICPKVKPPDAESSYPSLPYWLARRGERLELRGEELRLLYVAMTRAQDRLVLVGSTNRKADAASWAAGSTEPITTAELVGARSPLDWLLMWLPRATAEADWGKDRSGRNAIVNWQIHDGNAAVFADETPVWPEAVADDESGVDGNPALLEQVLARLSWEYPHRAATEAAAKTSVSAIRRRSAGEALEESLRFFEARTRRLVARSLRTNDTPPLSAAERGSAHHLFLQLVDLSRVGHEAELRGQAEEFVKGGVMKPEQVASLDFTAINHFWQSDLGRQFRVQADCIRRELAFTARFPAAEVNALMGKPEIPRSEEFVVVQGVADLAVLLPDEIWLVDFKTDEITLAEMPAKKRYYESQLRLYALALGKIYGRPVTQRWLHFLVLRKSESVAE